jgi:hypothetical protein
VKDGRKKKKNLILMVLLPIPINLIEIGKSIQKKYNYYVSTFFFSYFFLLLLDIVSFTLYMRRMVKRIKNSI